MSWFPFHYRDIKAFSDDNLPLSTASNEAAKLFDSAITQLALHDNDPVFGNLEQTLAKLMHADPNFVMGKVMNLSLQLLGENARQKPKLLYDVNNFADKAQKSNISSWEKMHLKALRSLVKEDLWSCTRLYDDILFEYPLDSFALTMSYLTGLYTAQMDLLRNIPARVVTEYSKSDRFYGTVNGKLCFGFEECNQFDEAERAGAIALDHTPNDIWAIHSIAHIKEETQRPRDGLKLLSDTESQWQQRASLVTHVWWHKALFHFQLGEFEEAITNFDDVILPNCKKDPRSFPLTDATSLLMRLQLEPEPIGIDLKDRWREVGNMYQNIVETDSTMFIFDDFHALIGCLFGNERESASKLLNSLETFSREAKDEYPDNWNGKNMKKYGFQLCLGLKEFAESDYEEAFRLLKPIRFDWQQLMSGSRAQTDLLNQVLIQSAIKSGNIIGAKKLLKERMANCHLVGNPEDGTDLLNQRLEAKIQSMM